MGRSSVMKHTMKCFYRHKKNWRKLCLSKFTIHHFQLEGMPMHIKTFNKWLNNNLHFLFGLSPQFHVVCTTKIMRLRRVKFRSQMPQNAYISFLFSKKKSGGHARSTRFARLEGPRCARGPRTSYRKSMWPFYQKVCRPLVYSIHIKTDKHSM